MLRVKAFVCSIYVIQEFLHRYFVKRAAGDEIINPIQSARMVTSESFSFTYGTIEVRAKMPFLPYLGWPFAMQSVSKARHVALSFGRKNSTLLTTADGNT